MSARAHKKSRLIEDVHASKSENDSPELRAKWIATAAYFLAKSKQVQGLPADPVRDWLEAEQAYQLGHDNASRGHQHVG